jgi:hypothetical protein
MSVDKSKALVPVDHEAIAIQFAHRVAALALWRICSRERHAAFRAAVAVTALLHRARNASRQ